jgi:hypothetical protein
MIDVTEFVEIVFSGLSALIIEAVEDVGETVLVRAKTRDGAVACLGAAREDPGGRTGSGRRRTISRTAAQRL